MKINKMNLKKNNHLSLSPGTALITQIFKKQRIKVWESIKWVNTSYGQTNSDFYIRQENFSDLKRLYILREKFSKKK